LDLEFPGIAAGSLNDEQKSSILAGICENRALNLKISLTFSLKQGISSSMKIARTGQSSAMMALRTGLAIA
jgi:hypothetical protein